MPGRQLRAAMAPLLLLAATAARAQNIQVVGIQGVAFGTIVPGIS